MKKTRVSISDRSKVVQQQKKLSTITIDNTVIKVKQEQENLNDENQACTSILSH